MKLASQPVRGGDSKYSTITHDNKMLAEEPDAGGAPPGGSNLERLANKDQVSTTEEGDTLDCGRDKVASLALVGTL